MGKFIFQNRLSFSVFVWLAITINIALNYGTLMHSASQFQIRFEQSMTQLLSVMNPVAAATAMSDHLTVVPKAKAIPTNDLQCMAENIFYESATQSYAGKIAVGQVVLNRVKKPGYPDNVCGVIYEGSQNVKTSTCQFSWTCAEHKGIDKSSPYWAESLKAAKELLTRKDTIIDITEGATNYHANYVKPPWSKTLHFVAQIDQHLFYK